MAVLGVTLFISGGKFYRDINFNGDYLWLKPGYLWPDLTDVGRGIFHLGDWNDFISSVHTSNGVATLNEDINLAGSTLTFLANKAIADLSTFGWNDRTSSIRNWGSSLG